MGLPDQTWPTSTSRYITVRSKKAIPAKARMKESDQRFLLTGMRPSSFEKPQRLPPMMLNTRNLGKQNNLVVKDIWINDLITNFFQLGLTIKW